MPSAMQPRIVDGPGGGVVRNLDPRHIPDQAWARARNVRYPTGADVIRSTDGYLKADSSDEKNPVMALWWYVSTVPSEPPRLVRILTNWLATGLNGGSPGWISNFPPDYTIDDVVTIDQYQDELIWCNGQSVWHWNGGALMTLAESVDPPGSGAPPLDPAIVEIHKEHVLLARTKLQPWRVYWSHEGNPFNWASTAGFTSNAGDMDFLDDATPIIAVKVLGDHAIVHKPARLYRMIFVGEPDLYIQEGIPGDDGALSARAPISIGSYQYYIGRNNFYRLGSFSEPIGDAIWPEVSDLIDWKHAHWVYAYRRLEYDEVCWKFPTRSSKTPNVSVIFNHRNQTWSLTDHDPGNAFTELPTDALPSTAFDDAIAPTSPPPVRGVFGQINGDIQVYGGLTADGAPIHAWAESKHFTDQLAPAKILAVPIFATGRGTLMVSLRAGMDPRHPLPAWPLGRPLPLAPVQTRPWVDVRGYGRLWQIRIESQALDTEWTVAALGAAVIPGGYAR